MHEYGHGRVRPSNATPSLRNSVMAELGLELRGSNIVDQLVEKQLDLEKREAALKSKVEEVVALKPGWTRPKPLRQLA